MSHQPKVANNMNNLKSKKEENINFNSGRENLTNNINILNQSQTYNKKTTKKCAQNINYNSENFYNTVSTISNEINCSTYFDKKYSEEENNFEINTVYTFGSNEMGQIGCDFDSKELNCFSPIPIFLNELSNKRIISIAAGDGHSVCVGKDGTVYAWGASACGQLGLDGNEKMPRDSEGYPYQPTPIPIKLISGNKIIEVSCGDAHTLALTKEGKIFSFGGAGCGQLGHPNINDMPRDADNCPYQPYPRLIETLKNFTVTHIACGKAHSLCIDSLGNLFTWGAGACGQLGVEDIHNLPVDDDGYPYQPVPKNLKSLKGINIIYGACGDVHTLVLTDKGEIYSFGGGSFGQLGLGQINKMPLDTDRYPFMPIPTKIDSLGDVHITSIACGDSHSMAIDVEGRLFAWGAAACGQLGISGAEGGLSLLPKDSEGNPYEPEPRLVSFFENMKVISVACGEAHTLVLIEGGLIYSFGGNSTGQLGYPEIKEMKAQKNSLKNSLRNLDNYNTIGKPQLINTLLGKNVLKLACGGVHNLVLTTTRANLANNLYSMLKEENSTDFDIIIWSNEQTKFVIKCHKIVLISRSNYFYDLIIKNKENNLELKKFNIIAFKTIIEYLYLDDNSFLNEINIMEDLLEYLKISKLLELTSLQSEIECKLNNHLLKFSEVLQSVIKFDENNQSTLSLNQNEQQFRGLFFLPNGACMLLLNEDIIDQVIKNSHIINFKQINQSSITQFNHNINNNSNNKYQSQKNSQDQVFNNKNNKISKTISNTGGKNANRISTIINNNILETFPKNINKTTNLFYNTNVLNYLSNNLCTFPNENFYNNNTNSNLNTKHKSAHSFNTKEQNKHSNLNTSINHTQISEYLKDDNNETNENLNLDNKNFPLEEAVTDCFGNNFNLNQESERIIENIEIDENNIKNTMSNKDDSQNKINKSTNILNESDIISDNIFEKFNYEIAKGFKGLFDIYNNLKNQIKFGDFIELLKKFYIVSPYLKFDFAFNYNNIYNNNVTCSNSNKNNNLNGQNFSSGFSNNISCNGMLHSYPLGLNLLKFFNDKDTSDLKIIVGEYTFFVHRAILICRSKFFELMLNEEMKENACNEVNISDYPAEEFFVFLLYLYSDQLQFEFDMALELLKAADMFAVEDLKMKLELFLSSKLDIENSAKLFKYASFFNYDRLKKICLSFISDNYKQVIETQQFEDLQREYMLELVRFCKTK